MEVAPSEAAGLRLNTDVVRRLLTDFLRDEINGAGFDNAVIGLSGGVDSALVAYLASEALGKEHVLALLMPYRSSSPSSREDAGEIVRRLGIRSETVDISAAVDALAAGDPSIDNVRKGNLMARARMIVLYDRSAREKGLVVGTSNKTEILLGYGTQHGDTTFALNPIGDLYKTQVWQLAEAVGVPETIVRKQP